MKKKKGIAAAALILAASLAAGGCGNAAGETGSAAAASSSADGAVTREVFAMDTYMSLTAYGSSADQAVHDAIAKIKELDAMLTTGDDTSEVGKINANGSGTLQEDGKELMKRSLELYESTDGTFDISIYPVMELWGFPTKEYRVPDEQEIREALKLVDASKIRFDGNTGEVSFAESGMKIDFGGIAKGYTSSKVMELFRQEGVTSGLVNLGGNVQALGTKPDGSDWRIGIRGPGESDGDAEDYVGILTASDKAVITSGGYERYFEKDGKRYHHIIDPSTGYPAESGVVSSTIVSADGTLADGLSTTLFILGPDRAAEYWRAHADEFDYVLMKDDGSLLVSEGLENSFTSDRKITIVRRDG